MEKMVPGGQYCTAQPTSFVPFQTSCVKWPVLGKMELGGFDWPKYGP